MKENLNQIKEYLKDKNICLLGNARSILNTKKDIDSFDIVCRMNRGVPQGREKYIGSKTNIVFMSTKFREIWKQQFNAKFIVWMTECQKLATDWIKKNAIQNPPGDWRELRAKYPEDKLPSTGCIAINFLLRHIKFKSLTIYGFDFFKTGTWYHNLNNQAWHPVELEEKLIREMIKDQENIKLII